MNKKDMIVIGASAGGVEALKILVSSLPENFPATIFLVLHVSPHGYSVLPQILSRVGRLSAIHAKDGLAIQPGRIYIAPPDHHLLIKSGYMELSRGAKENGHRPSVDPLFRSAARSYNGRVIGVILSGVLDDGSAGLMAVTMRRGTGVVQHPEDAMYNGMPLNALQHVPDAHVVPIAEMGALLMELVQQDAPLAEPTTSDLPETETRFAELDMETIEHDDHPGKPASLACPECGGTLWEIEEGELMRYRCRVGHAYTAQSLLAEQTDALEDAFWAAFRALEESADLAQRMADRAKARGHQHSVEHFEERAKTAKDRAELIRTVLLKGVNFSNLDSGLTA